MVTPSEVRARTGQKGHRTLLVLGVLGSLLAGCNSVVEFGDDASTGDPGPAGTTTTMTGLPPATVEPSGVEVTSGTGSTATESGTTDDTAGNNTFLIDPDFNDVFPGCSVFEQDCAPGEKCNIWANDGGNVWNATRCVPLDRAPGGPDDPCTVEGSGVSGIDSCDIGAVCWDVDRLTLEGTCVSFCTGSESAPICQGGLTCTAGNLIYLCLPTCDPLVQNCIDGEACYVLEDTTECAPVASDEGGAVFDTCSVPNACELGLNCTDAAVVGLCDEGAEACCTPFCDLQSPTCPEGTQCTSAFAEGMVPPGYEDVGVCGQDPE